MHDSPCDSQAPDRRSFLKKGITAGAIGVGLGFHLLGNDSVLAQTEGSEEGSGNLNKGDAAMLRFAAAAEILESDFWVQYNELGGIQDGEVPGGSGNPIYTKKLQVLDADFPQYIHDNTDDEITHFTFLNAYLESKGADPALAALISINVILVRKRKPRPASFSMPLSNFEEADSVREQVRRDTERYD